MQHFTLHLHGIKVAVNLGWYDAERSFPQVIEVDALLGVCNSLVGTADNLDGTPDYAAVVAMIREHLMSQEWRVVEYMITRLCDLVLEHFPEVEFVELSVKKRIMAELEYAHFQGKRVRISNESVRTLP
jgi:dihydroneopterin aldolase